MNVNPAQNPAANGRDPQNTPKPPNPPAVKKPPSLMRKFAGKVNAVSSKMTELKCVTTEIQSCALLCLGLIYIYICLM